MEEMSLLPVTIAESWDSPRLPHLAEEYRLVVRRSEDTPSEVKYARNASKRV